ncbi:endonuclease MutS2 [Dethiobacter alkaliphilus]|uniref:endonuclease MutS2 n=1 Tax=Dethiobacter alkaliphilus TaxID=427926 RepID=UPI002226530A|nr:endonuclease MutS2 [Dethiobacter alkaliphilus]MCW3491171.1 endonuclease MutS2 [Dethiobacter alkaliphilus]
MEREIRLLEFAAIRQALMDYTVTPMGSELAEDLAPTSQLELARRWQAETTEAVSLIKRNQIGLERVPDLRRILDVAARGSMLGEEQLFGVWRLLQAVTKLKGFFKEKEGYPVLAGLTRQMDALPNLREELKNTLDDEGRLRDQASAELLRLRRSINGGEQDLRERFDRFVRNPGNHKALQENLVTVRGDRLVVPIRQEYRSQVPGVVHDQSASGATLFIEPLWAVEANNRLTVLRREEEKERERILVRLSQWAGGEKETLVTSLTLYAELDFIIAKARLSLAQKASEPKLNDRGYLNILSGRHPLLTGDVVPISLEMGENLRTLVITGPNTGGKTVTLKTVGLFSIMAQSGLHVPADEGSELAVFPRIFADIGDEQDITQSLSTFSGHLKNIIDILGQLVPGSLVLLDEVGAGTDPTEGAGLAMAILEYLHNFGAVTVGTTHYSQLKTFAYVTQGMENASVEFDVATLRPTYQLLVGVPGVSNAFAIAQRLGLDQDIIRRGKEFLSQEETRLEEVVADLVADRQRIEVVSRQVEDERQQSKALLLQIQQEKEDLARRKSEILEKARRDAQETVISAKREAQQLLKQLRKMAAAAPPLQEEVESAAEKLRKLDTDFTELQVPQSTATPVSAEELTEGSEVYVNSLGQRGTVVKAGQSQIQVQVGMMRITVEPGDLSYVKPTKKESPRPTTMVSRRDVPPELDLRGHTLDEAAMKVETYLDEAALAGLKEVRLIHGKGTGRLRAGLQDYLKGHPHVASMRIGQPAEGGTGATVIEIK